MTIVPVRARRRALDLGRRILELAQDRLAALEQQAPGIGRRRAETVAHEQRLAELLLEPVDLPADRRLRNAEIFRRAAVAAELDDGLEVAKRARIHRRLDASEQNVIEAMKIMPWTQGSAPAYTVMLRSGAMLGGAAVKFGLMTQLQMPRPWEPKAELTAYRNMIDQAVAGDARGLSLSSG